MGTETFEAIDWHQPFHWGLLTMSDDENKWTLPEPFDGDKVYYSGTCVTVPVLHDQDVRIPTDWPDDVPIPQGIVQVFVMFTPAVGSGRVDSEGTLLCESGKLAIGDAEIERVIDVPPGLLKVQVSLFPKDHADAVVIRLFR